MYLEDIEKTEVWQLYEKGRNYLRRLNAYAETDRNYRFYNGNQWEGAKLGDVEPVQKNFIKPIIKYKVAVVHDNLYAIVYNAENYEKPKFQPVAEACCEMLNRYAGRAWEKEYMDFKGRSLTLNAAINDEGVLYIDFDRENMLPVNEIVDKTDVYYGNENSDDIQSQPYILIRRRMPVMSAVELAIMHGVSQEDTRYIVGDNDTSEESGDAAKEEVDDQVTVVYKFYKKNGTVHFAIATQAVVFVEDADIGISRYPIAHMVWEEKRGSARGEGEARNLIANQIEVNRIEMRRLITSKGQSYPQRIADTSKIANPEALTRVGAIIKTKGQTVDDVNKVVGTLLPASMSGDVLQLQQDLIAMSRELAGAGEAATGSVDPESASGKAILAVQQASRAPVSFQKESYKTFVEDVARIWLEYLVAYSDGGVPMQQVQIDPVTGEERITMVKVPQSVLQRLKATVKVDITPKSVYDRFAMEQTIENLLAKGFFNAQRVSELEIYYKVLPDDAVAPKQMIGKAIKYIKAEQQKIAQTEMQAQAMMQRANRFIQEGPKAQATQLAQAMGNPAGGGGTQLPA